MSREISYAQAISEAIQEEMERDERVYAAGEDIGTFGGNFGETKGLIDEYGPDRVRDTPLAEIGIAGHALGAAVGGLRPLVELGFGDFCATAGDEMFNQIPKMAYVSGGNVSVPLTVFAAEGAGINAGAQHSQTVHGYMGHIPGWVVVVGTTPYDMKGLLKSGIRDDNPVLVLGHKLLSERRGEVPEEEYALPLGEAKVEQEGDDVTVVATQLMYHRALEAADQLDDVSIELVSPRTIAPLDVDTIAESVAKTGRLVVVDETVLRHGTQGYVVSQIVEQEFFSLDAPPKMVGVKDAPIPFSPPLEQEVQPSVDRITEAIRDVF